MMTQFRSVLTAVSFFLFFYTPYGLFGTNRLDSLWNVYHNEALSAQERLVVLDDIIWDYYMYSQPDSVLILAHNMYQLASQNGLEKYTSYSLLAEAEAQSVLGNSTQTIVLLHRARKIDEKLGDRKGLAAIFNNIGNAHEEIGAIDSALYYLEMSLRYYQDVNDQFGERFALNNLGRVYSLLENWDRAIACSYKSIRISESFNDLETKEVALLNLGVLYSKKNDYAKAIELFQQVVATSKHNAHNQNNLALAYNNIGDTYNKLEQHDSALVYFQKALTVYKTTKTTQRIGTSYLNIGSVYLNMGVFKDASYYFDTAQFILESIDDFSGKSLLYANMSELYSHKAQYRLAVKYADRALEYADRAEDLALKIGASQKLYEAAFASGDFKKAFETLMLHSKWRDQRNTDANMNVLLRAEYAYEYQKQLFKDSIKSVLEKEVYEADLVAKDAQIKQQRTVNYALAFIFIISTIFGFIVYNRFKTTRRQAEQIRRQKELVEEQRDVANQARLLAEQQQQIIALKNREILDSIEYAKRLQDAILPPLKLVKEYFEESFVFYRPKDVISGDFYWMETKDGITLFAVADCTGHGVPGAMISVVCANALQKAVQTCSIYETGDILNKTRQFVLETFEKSMDDIQDGMDISLCALDEKNNKLYWSGANNPLWIIRKNSSTIDVFKGDRQPIGKYFKAEDFKTEVIDVYAGDIIYLFSDGYVDQFGSADKGRPSGVKFKPFRLKNLLVEIANHPLDEQRTILVNAFEEWQGKLEQVDDVCVIGVKVKEAVVHPFSKREIEIINELALGLNSKEIADKLFISPNTVDTHRRKILKKIGVKNTTELVIYCQSNNIV